MGWRVEEEEVIAMVSYRTTLSSRREWKNSAIGSLCTAQICSCVVMTDTSFVPCIFSACM